jgi:hypothetical protein
MSMGRFIAFSSDVELGSCGGGERLAEQIFPNDLRASHRVIGINSGFSITRVHVGNGMKKWFIALVCASTFLFAQNALAAFTFKRFAHCGDGLVTVKTCECHASNSRVCFGTTVTPDTTAIRSTAVAESSLAQALPRMAC